MPTQATIHEADKTKVTRTSARTGATLKLIEPRSIFAFVWIPPIERNDSDSQWIVWTGKSYFCTNYHVGKGTLSIQTIDERSIRQVAWRDREGHWNHNRIQRVRRTRRTAVTG